jgi:hypothetical protein
MLSQHQFATVPVESHTVNITTKMMHFVSWTARHPVLGAGVLSVTMLHVFSLARVLHVPMDSPHFSLVLKPKTSVLRVSLDNFNQSYMVYFRVKSARQDIIKLHLGNQRVPRVKLGSILLRATARQATIISGQIVNRVNLVVRFQTL